MKTNSAPFLIFYALSVFISSCSQKADDYPPPPPVPKTDCTINLEQVSDNGGGFIYTNYYNNASGRPDSTKNSYVFNRYYYRDTLVVKREQYYANSRQLRNYDSLFYNATGQLTHIKLYTWDPAVSAWVQDFDFVFTYSGNKVSRMVISEEVNAGNWRVNTFDYTWDANGNATDLDIHWYNGTTGHARYYYGTVKNPFPQLKFPVGLFFHAWALSRPYFIPDYIAMHHSTHRMIKRDDASGNIGVPLTIGGGLDSGYVRIIDNGYLWQMVHFDCK